LNRIGNLLVPNDNYCKFEDWVMPLLDQMVHEQETLDQVFLDAACGGDEARDVVVLDEEADHFAQAGRENGADRPPDGAQRTWRLSDEPINPDSQTEELDPQDHFVYEFDCPCEAVGLEAYAFVAVEQVLKRVRLVKVPDGAQRTWRLSDEPINPDSQTEELDPQVRAETKWKMEHFVSARTCGSSSSVCESGLIGSSESRQVLCAPCSTATNA
jgi:hypothetical protein